MNKCLNPIANKTHRSHKEKRSAYAPEAGVRYDGVYRIEKCWRKPGIQVRCHTILTAYLLSLIKKRLLTCRLLQGFKVCRYLFVRCDNDPAPWTRFVITLLLSSFISW